jgi:hypothetical protein
MPDYNIPMSNDTSPQLNTNIPMAGDTRLPLAVKPFEPIDVNKAQAETYKLQELQGEVGQAQDTRDRSAEDRQTVDAYLKSGGSLATPDGLAQAAEQLKGKVSTETYTKLAKAAEDKRNAELEYKDKLNQVDTSDLKIATAKQEDALKMMSQPLEAYEASKAKAPGDEAAALQAYQTAKAATIQMLAQQKDAAGKPAYSPEVLKQFEQMSPESLKHRIEDTSWKHAMLKEASEMKLREAQTESYKANAELKNAQAEDIPEKDRLAQAKIDAQIQKGGMTPEQIHTIAQGIADYSTSGLSKWAIGKPIGAEIMAEVRRINPDYDDRNRIVQADTAKHFASGKEAATVKSFTVLDSHLQTLDKTIDALDNGDVKSLNALSNFFTKELNLSTAPTDFETVKRIVSDEIVKAVTGSAGALGDREAAEATLSAASSPQALKSAIDKYRELAKGQLKGLEEQRQKGLNYSIKNEAGAKPAATEGFLKDTPDQKNKRESERKQILEQERRAEQDKLDNLPENASKEDRHRIEQNLEALAKELKGMGGLAPENTAKPTTSNW